MRVWKVLKAHRQPDGVPLSVRRGDRLALERRRTEWEGWVWCTSQSGIQGWVPESWVAEDRDGCVMLRDYTARELSVEPGRVVRGDDVVAGWLWCVDERGVEGWVPSRCLRAEGGG